MNPLEKLKLYINLTETDEIARRYFIINSFDGVLTIVGIIFGFYFSDILDSKALIAAGIGAGVAMCISGMSGAYLSESAERVKDLKSIERSMLNTMSDTLLGKATKVVPLFTAVIDGISPLISAIIVIFPFFFTHTIAEKTAFFISLSIAGLLLFILGAFMGKFSKENMFIYGIKTLLVGVVTGLVLFTLKLL